MKYSDLLFWLSIIIVFIPIFLQLILGHYAIQNKSFAQLRKTLIFNTITQFTLTLISIIIQIKSFNELISESSSTCLNPPPPIVGVFISFYLMLLIVSVWYFQFQKIVAKLLKKQFKVKLNK